MISVVIPAYNEASNLRTLWEKLRKVFDELAEESFECVVVDDGSFDDSVRILGEIHKEDPRLGWIKLTKNRGSHDAIGCGLKASRGQAVIVLAADLQDPPEVFRELIGQWRSGAKVVWAVRKSRPSETILNRTASQLYYLVMNLLLPHRFPSTGADFFLADRQVVDVLGRRYQRHSPNVLFQVASLGFASSQIYYVKQKRHSGKSKWGFKKRVYLFVDSVLAFSPIPLRLAVTAGLVATAIWWVGAGIWPAAVVCLFILGFCAWRYWALTAGGPAIVGQGSHEPATDPVR